MPKPPKAVPSRQTFVQTDRKAHLALGKLAVKHASAAAILHQLIGLMDRKCAVCISHQTLAEMLGIHLTTVKKSMKVLREGNWIQQIQIGKSGTVNAYVVNSRVAWADKRENLRLAHFSAQIIANASDQDQATLEPTEMRKVPLIHPPEEALPTGEWPPESQTQIPGMEAVAKGMPEYDPETGEVYQTDLEDFTTED